MSTHQFRITRADGINQAGSVDWAVTGSGPDPASADDFVGGVFPSGTATFASGETEKIIEIEIVEDATVEADEGFTVTLSNPSSNHSLGTASASSTITNDDDASLSITVSWRPGFEGGFVLEDTPASTVLADLSTTTASTFSEFADPDGKFAVVGSTLVLAAPLDYEDKAGHSVTVRATATVGGATNDQALFVTVGNVVNEIDAALQPHRYWRVVAFSSSSNVVGAREVGLLNSAGVDQTFPGITVLSSAGWTTPANVFDNNSATTGNSASTIARNTPAWIGADWGASSANWPIITGFSWTNLPSAQAPTSGVLQYSDDNVTWSDSFYFFTAAWTSALETRTFTRPALDTAPYINITDPPLESYSGTNLTAGGNAAIVDGRMTFDGDGDSYTKTGLTAEQLFITDNWATESYMKGQATASSFDTFIHLGSTSNNAALQLIIRQNGTALEVFQNGAVRLSAAAVFTGSNEVHFAVVHIRTSTVNEWRLFVDGVLKATTPTSSWPIPTLADGLTIGRDAGSGPERSIAGTVDDFRVYHYAKYTSAFTPPPRLP